MKRLITSLVLMSIILVVGIANAEFIGDKEGRIARIDGNTEVLMGIDYPHHEIHEGDRYTLKNFVDLSLNEVLDIQFTTPDSDKMGHCEFIFVTESETEIHIYENVTINVAGTAVTMRNKNRNVADASIFTVATILNTSVSNANADTDPTSAIDLSPTKSGSGKIGGNGGSRNETVVKRNEDYAIRFIANAAGWVDYYIDCYQHTSRE